MFFVAEAIRLAAEAMRLAAEAKRFVVEAICFAVEAICLAAEAKRGHFLIVIPLRYTTLHCPALDCDKLIMLHCTLLHFFLLQCFEIALSSKL